MPPKSIQVLQQHNYISVLVGHDLNIMVLFKIDSHGSVLGLHLLPDSSLACFCLSHQAQNRNKNIVTVVFVNQSVDLVGLVKPPIVNPPR